jgi:hypothetical protein
MDWLMTAFQWLMTHQPPLPWSFIWGGISFALTASFIKGLLDEDEDWTYGPAVLSFVYFVVFGLIGGLIFADKDNYYWYHMVSMLVGWFGIPALLGILLLAGTGAASVAKAVGRAVSSVWGRAVSGFRNLRDRLAEEAEAERQAEVRSPEHVLARCQAVLDDFRARLPKDVTAPETMRRAGDLFEALKELYKLDQSLAELSPGDDSGLAEKVRQADNLFTEVALEKECPDLVTKLRQERHAIGPVRGHIHAAIEALVLLITTLPDQMASKMALQVPHEYQQVVDDMRQPDGRSLLPAISTDEPQSPVVPPMAKRQTA